MPDFDIPDNDHNIFLSSALWSCLRIVQVQKNHHSGPTTAELTKKYFSQVFSFTKNTLIFAGSDNNADVLQKKPLIHVPQLERWIVEGLYQQYRVDFEMFGYSPKLYLDMAKT